MLDASVRARVGQALLEPSAIDTTLDRELLARGLGEVLRLEERVDVVADQRGREPLHTYRSAGRRPRIGVPRERDVANDDTHAIVPRRDDRRESRVGPPAHWKSVKKTTVAAPAFTCEVVAISSRITEGSPPPQAESIETRRATNRARMRADHNAMRAVLLVQARRGPLGSARASSGIGLQPATTADDWVT